MKKLLFLGIVLSTVLMGSLLVPTKTNARADVIWQKLTADVPLSDRAELAYPRIIINGDHLEIWTENAVGDLRHFSSGPDSPIDIWTNPALWITVTVANVHEPWIMLDGSTYKMWYNKTPNTAYRTSVDGVNWSAETICTFNVTQAWDGDRITPTIIKDGDIYKMYYNAAEGAGSGYIGYATSTDGTNWYEPQDLGKIADNSASTNNNLVLKQGGVGEWDGNQAGEALYSTHVLKNSYGSYEMWYGGNTNGSTYKIGYATSPDGISWTKHSGNPVITGTDGKWDSTGIFYPAVFEITGPLVAGSTAFGANFNALDEPGGVPIDQNSLYFMVYTKGDWSGQLGLAATNRISETPVQTVTENTEELPATGSGIPQVWVVIIPASMLGLITLRYCRRYLKRN